MSEGRQMMSATAAAAKSAMRPDIRGEGDVAARKNGRRVCLFADC